LDIFKKFKHDKIGKTNIATTILVDSSGSMKDDDFRLAMRSAYCIADALEKTGSKVMILSFAVNFREIKPFNRDISSIKLERGTGGGTELTSSLNYTEKATANIMKQENIKKSMLIVISDCWFNDDIKNLNGKQATILSRIKKKSKVVFFCIHDFSHNYKATHHYHDILTKLSNHIYYVDDYEQLYPKMQDFIRKYEQEIHLNIARGFI